MKIIASLTLAAMCLAAAPAVAGPAGMGLPFTQEVAQKRLMKEHAAKAQAAADCAAPKTSETDKVDAKADAPAACRAS